MQFGGATSIVLLLVAAVWIAYVVPVWVRRRNYLATEQNAMRLQQTLRVMAETAEVPVLDRVEMSSRGIAEQERRLRAARKAAAKAEREREEAARRDLPRVPVPGSLAERRAAMRQLRQRRRMTSLAGLLSLLVIFAGIVIGFAAGNWWPATLGVAGLLGALAVLVQLSRVESAQRAAFARRRPEPRAAGTIAEPKRAERARPVMPPVIETLMDEEPVMERDAAELPDEVELGGWTPVPVPPPLYITRASFEEDSAALERSIADAEPDGGPEGPDGPGGPGGPGGHDDFSEKVLAALHEEARRNEQAIRDAHRQPGVTTFGRRDGRPVLVHAAEHEQMETTEIALPAPRAQAEAGGPWAAMGVVGEQDSGMGDLDEVLLRRRAG